MEAINQVVVEFLREQPVKRGKVKVADVVTKFQDTDFQDKLQTIIKENLPKQKRAAREKKLKDPDAPKRPRSSYIWFCGDKRAGVVEEFPEAKATEVSKKLGALWKSKYASAKKRAKWVKKAAEDKERYTEAMKGYDRPSDDEIEAKLLAMGKRVPGKGKNGKKKRKKKDPNAPKRPCSAYIYFCKDMRTPTKEEHPDLSAQDISRKLGELWKNKYAKARKRTKWVDLAAEDKERYEEEKANYTPPVVDEEASAPSPKKRGKRSKKKVVAKVESKSDSESDSEEEKVVTPKKRGRRSKASQKKVVKVVESDSDDSDSEEEKVVTPKPKAKKARKSKKAKKSPRRKVKAVKIQIGDEETAQVTEADLFSGDDNSSSEE
jgi:hypothetical protein